MQINFRMKVWQLVLLPVLVILLGTGCPSTGSGEDDPEEILIEKSGLVGTLTIPGSGKVTAPEGKQVTMTKDHIEIGFEAGETYKNVYLSVTDNIVVSNMGNDYNLRAAAYINGGPVEEKSVSSAVISGTIENTTAEDIVINSQNDNFNGIIVDGETTYRITNPTITLNGHGGDDFAGFGAGIMATGTSDVVIENAYIKTTGAIRTAIWAGGDAKLLVKNSEVLASDGDTVDFPTSMMNEVPWILGLAGNLRATNVLGGAQATYLNSRVASERWGALSTDSTRDNAKLTAINTDIIIYGDSGYGSYADSVIQNYYYGSRFFVPSYGLIVAAGNCGAVFAKSSQTNVGELYTEIPAAHRDEATVINSGGYGVMWHQNKGGTVTVKEKTEFNCDKTVFLIKSGGNAAVPNIIVDDAKLNTKNGIILHLMESDDPGMGGGPPGSDTMWAKEYVVPTVTPAKDENVTTAVNEETVTASFSNMTVNGNIYNTRWTVGQNLSVVFTNAEIQGVISAGKQYHVNVSPGGKITKATYYEIGNVGVTPEAVVSNGMLVTMRNNSVWTVTGTSYISSLDIGEGCQIKASSGRLVMKIDDKEVTLEAGKSYTGNIKLELN
jgi:hypothetical protein